MVVSTVDVLPGNCINGILPACVLYPVFEVVNGGTPSREVTGAATGKQYIMMVAAITKKKLAFIIAYYNYAHFF